MRPIALALTRRAALVAALVLAAVGLHGGSPPRAHCALCFTGPCYSNAMCFRGCVCMKRGMDLEGACFSSGAIDEARADGYLPAE